MNDKNLTDPKFHSTLGRDLKTDFDLMRTLANGLVDLAIAKDKAYGASWKRRGGIGAYMTIVRKPDRLEAQMELNGYNIFDVSVAPEDGESIDETLRDTVNYCLLVLTTRELIRKELKALEEKSGVDEFTESHLQKARDYFGPQFVQAQVAATVTGPQFQNQNGDGGLSGDFDLQDGSPSSGYVNQG